MNSIMSILWKLRKSDISFLASIKSPDRIVFGKDIKIESGCRIQGPEDHGGVLSIGNECVFRNGTYISARRGEILIADYCYFAHRSWIGGRGKIHIGQNSIFGPNTVVISSNHDLTSDCIPRFDFPEVPGEIHIGSNVWIGANVVVLPGASVGDNSIIGAGSVVAGEIGTNCLAFGNPASVKKKLVTRDERRISGLVMN